MGNKGRIKALVLFLVLAGLGYSLEAAPSDLTDSLFTKPAQPVETR